MVSIMWAAIAMSLGFLCYLLPAALAPMFPPQVRKAVGDKYGWLSNSAFGRPRLRRKALGGYTKTIAEYDSEKQADEVDIGEDGHVRDYDDRLGRLYNKTFGAIYDRTTMVLDAQLAELAYWHHKHMDSAVMDAGGSETVNPFFEVPKDHWQIADPRDAMYLMAGDAEPDDPNTAEDFTEMALAEYRSEFGVTEMVAGITGFMAAFGAVIFAQQYLLDGSGGGGGGSVAPPVPMGQVAIPVDAVVMLL